MRSIKKIRISKPAREKTPAAKDARWWASPTAVTSAIVILIGAVLLIAGVQSWPEPANAASVAARAAENAADRAEAKRLGMQAAPPPSAVAESRPRAAAGGDDLESSPTDSGSSVPAAPVTVTGCLERDDDMFRLKDAAGAAVPKARSWKSGFLKKSAPSIEVVDSANRLRLPAHVGERVSVTGTLLDRKMTVRSLRRLAPSCDGATSKT